MSKSFDWAIKTVSNPRRSSFADLNWNEAAEITRTEEICRYYIEGEHFTLQVEGDKSFELEIKFDAEDDYDYFTCETFVSDGTLFFELDAMIRCLTKILCLGSYNKNIGEPQPGDYIKYTIGNFVRLQYPISPEQDKPWLRTRTVLVLPLRMQIIR